jgi:molybdopterin-containing oxidoreductase family iron-sulfur binding subunit
MAGFKDFKVRWGMVIDIDKCDGCGDCILACEAENNIPPLVSTGEPAAENTDRLRSLNWLTVYELDNGKKNPDNDSAYLLRPCMQCGYPPCVSVCPVIATTKDEEGGIVSQIYPRCIGCRYCMAACPYHSRYFNWYDPKWPEGMEKTLSPHTSVRPRGVVEKCHFCHHRFMYVKAEKRVNGEDPLDIKDGEYTTACSDACPDVIKFGDLNNPDHEVYNLARSKYAFRLLARLHTDPQVIYLSKREWVRRQGDNYLEGEELPAHGGYHGGGHGAGHDDDGHGDGHGGGQEEGGGHHG